MLKLFQKKKVRRKKSNMKIKVKRFIAFIIDIFIVSIISEALSNVSFINIYKDKYIETYSEYQKVYDEFVDNKITLEKYNSNVIHYNYELSKLSIISNSIYIVIFIAYFVGINCLYEGQTLGKKLMNIKIVGENDNKISAWIYLLRTILITGIFGTFLLTISILIFKENMYYNFSYIIGLIQYIFQLIVGISIVVNKNGKGLHDLICKTKVIELKTK